MRNGDVCSLERHFVMCAGRVGFSLFGIQQKVTECRFEMAVAWGTTMNPETFSTFWM
jgi:hypothetical protein